MVDCVSVVGCCVGAADVGCWDNAAVGNSEDGTDEEQLK